MWLMNHTQLKSQLMKKRNRSAVQQTPLPEDSDIKVLQQSCTYLLCHQLSYLLIRLACCCHGISQS